MYLVGLTGGIGSGKSTVAKIFNFLGIPVFNADEETKLLYLLDSVKSDVKKHFGKKVFENDEIAFDRLSKLVFSDQEKLSSLESIVYPLLKKRFTHWIHEHSESSYLVKEAAVMLEKGSYKDLDKIILVTAPAEMRIQRVIHRNGVSREFVLSRMENQWSDEKKKEYCDYVIINDQSNSLIRQVMDIHLSIQKQIVDKDLK